MNDTEGEIAAEVDHSDIKNDLTRIQRIAKTIFKIIGAFVSLYAIFFLVATQFWLLYCFICVLILSALIILSIGMFYLRKWAAVGFSLLCCFFAFVLLSDPFPLAAKPPDWPGFIAGFLFMIPAVLTVTQWRLLVWRTKQDAEVTLHDG